MPQRKCSDFVALFDNAHVTKVGKDTLSALQWKVLLYAAYLLNCASSDYHLF